MKRPQIGNVVRVREAKVTDQPQSKGVARGPVPLAADVLKLVAGGKSATVDTPNKGW